MRHPPVAPLHGLLGDNNERSAKHAGNCQNVFRREAVLRSLQSGQLHGEQESILTPVLPESQRTSVSQISPALLGGEFLPPFKNNEVEIARTTLCSVTYDITAVFVYFARGRYYYGVVDEYDGGTLSGSCR
ncbi:MAG: hypothetical protein ACUVXB_02430 [Bryobacteraceae bacterium]